MCVCVRVCAFTLRPHSAYSRDSVPSVSTALETVGTESRLQLSRQILVDSCLDSCETAFRSIETLSRQLHAAVVTEGSESRLQLSRQILVCPDRCQTAVETAASPDSCQTAVETAARHLSQLSRQSCEGTTQL